MTPVNRRTFIKGATALPAVAGWSCHQVGGWDAEILHALGEVVLPSGLAEDGPTRIVHAFTDWADGIEAGAERNHGYGTSEIRYAPESPSHTWSDQLHGLDDTARDMHQRNFATLDLDRRRDVLQSILSDYPTNNLPAPHNAPHIAIALMAFFADSAEGVDLAYGASIKKETCRPLNQSSREPVQLPEATA